MFYYLLLVIVNVVEHAIVTIVIILKQRVIVIGDISQPAITVNNIRRRHHLDGNERILNMKSIGPAAIREVGREKSVGQSRQPDH